MATSSMQRSLKLIKKYGWVYDIVEQPYNRFTGKRKDLFGFGDILCLDGSRTILIQACGTDYQPHIRKIKENEFVRPWLEAGNELQVWSWRQILKKRGGKAKYWSPRIVDILVDGGELYLDERVSRK